MTIEDFQPTGMGNFLLEGRKSDRDDSSPCQSLRGECRGVAGVVQRGIYRNMTMSFVGLRVLVRLRAW